MSKHRFERAATSPPDTNEALFLRGGCAVVKTAAKHVIGPLGHHLTLADLPPLDTKRWVIRRKAEVVAAVRGGLLSLEEACNRYALNPEEFQSWEYCIDRYGLRGLRTTRTQFYRMSTFDKGHLK
jgi:hypothetical protein